MHNTPGLSQIKENALYLLSPAADRERLTSVTAQHALALKELLWAGERHSNLQIADRLGLRPLHTRAILRALREGGWPLHVKKGTFGGYALPKDLDERKKDALIAARNEAKWQEDWGTVSGIEALLSRGKTREATRYFKCWTRRTGMASIVQTSLRTQYSDIIELAQVALADFPELSPKDIEVIFESDPYKGGLGVQFAVKDEPGSDYVEIG